MNNTNRCENCGGTLSYSPTKNLIVCDHCDTQYPVTAKRSSKLTRRYTPDYTPEANSDAPQFYCNNCKTIHTVEPGKVSHRCPSCGGTNITSATGKAYEPDGIIPFALERTDAIKIFNKWLKKRKFAPNDLQSMAKNDKLSAVYVPVYNFSGTSSCMYNGSVKKVHTDSNGTIYSTIHTIRDMEIIPIKDALYCANNVVEEKLVAKIITFDPNSLVPYSGEYLFGYYGVESTRSVHDAYQNLARTYERNNEAKVRAKVKEKYDEIIALNCTTRFDHLVFNHAYVPVYMNHYVYKNKQYHCYISGIDGKVAGHAPKSVGKIFAVIGAGLLVLASAIIAIVATVL